MTDRAAVNHASNSRLELAGRSIELPFTSIENYIKFLQIISQEHRKLRKTSTWLFITRQGCSIQRYLENH